MKGLHSTFIIALAGVLQCASGAAFPGGGHQPERYRPERYRPEKYRPDEDEPEEEHDPCDEDPSWAYPTTSTSSAASTTVASVATTIVASNFASADELREMVDKICGAGLRLPGGPAHLDAVKYMQDEMAKLPGLTMFEDEFTLDNWQPDDNSMYSSGHLRIEDEPVDIVASIAYSLPTNGTWLSGELLFLTTGDDITTLDIAGKIVIRDYPTLSLPTGLFSSFTYYQTNDTTNNELYTRPFIRTPADDLIACSLQGAAGYISAFNVSRQQLEGYYTVHSGVHWNMPALFIGAEQYETVKSAALLNRTASIKIDATSGVAQVPRFHYRLQGASDETIVLATHTDGNTYVQENGPAALITLARYFSALPMSARNKTILFAFEASHLAHALDSDKTLAKALDAAYDDPDDTLAFVIAIEHLGTREILPYDAPAGTPGQVLNYSGNPETILWAVGPVQPALDSVVNIAQERELTGVAVAPGFPPINPADMVPTWRSMGGLGTYYTNALLPSMGLISGPWSLWAPGFGAEALDYDRLRMQYLAIGDTILALSKYSRAELAGNYTEFRARRANGTATTITLNYDNAQWITDPDGVYD